MLIVLCGVSGVGKTTIGTRLAEALEIPFIDADDFHPVSNVDKMKSGVPLSDEDRRPWLEELSSCMSKREKTGGAVLAFSALKESYRKTLESGYEGDIRWVFLTGPTAALADRLAKRSGHYFDPGLLKSQLETLEIPDYGLHVDVEASPQEIVNTTLERLREE